MFRVIKIESGFKPNFKLKILVMKNVNNRSYSLLLVPFIAMFSSIGVINAQNRVQNRQQGISNTQRFIDVDANSDGFIGQDEYKFGSFNEFDTDQDGKLSRIEYQRKNRSTKRNSTGNSVSGRNRGKGNCQVTQRGNGMGQRMDQGKGQKRGTGVCPKDNQCSRKKNNRNNWGRRAS